MDIRKHGYLVAGYPIQLFSRENVINKNIDTILISNYVAQESIEQAIKKENAEY